VLAWRVPVLFRLSTVNWRPLFRTRHSSLARLWLRPMAALGYLVFADQYFDSVPDVPVGPRALLPLHTWHLKFSSRHPSSLEWRGESWLRRDHTTISYGSCNRFLTKDNHR
jgi:hypothetical protein